MSRDIVVVGAGIVGCAVGYELARRGASVEIVDARPAGAGATQASGGMLAPWHEVPDGGPLLDLAAQGLAEYDNFVSTLAADAPPFLYRRHGTLEVAASDAGVRRLESTIAKLRQRGVPCEGLDAAAIRHVEPALSATARGGILFSSQGLVGASDLVRALVTAARRHGARLVQQGRVVRIVRQHGETQVVTERGAIAADVVVIAAGSWSAQVAVEGAAPLPVTPVRGQLLHLGLSEPPLSRVVWGEGCYLIPWPDGTVLVGATVEQVGFDESTTVDGIRRLLNAAADLLPKSVEARFLSARAGLRPATPDHLPIIGRSSVLPSVCYATGHYRNGVLLAPLTARLVADAILEDRDDPLLRWTTPARFGAL